MRPPVSPSPISSTPAPIVNEPSPVASPTSPIASPIGSPVESPNDWDTIFEEGFEAESDNFQNAGNKIVSNEYHTGASSACIRRKQKLKSAQKIVSEYSDLMVDFYYYGQGMEDGQEERTLRTMNGIQELLLFQQMERTRHFSVLVVKATKEMIKSILMISPLAENLSKS